MSQLSKSLLAAAEAVLERCRALDVRLWLAAGSLRYSAPPGVVDDAMRAAVAEVRPALVALLRGDDPSPAPAGGYDFTERWGPGLADPTPSVNVPADSWRWRVANLPQAEWSRWRARAAAILAPLGRAPTVDEIREADRRAALEMGIAGAEVPAAPMPALEADPYAAAEREAIRAAAGVTT